MSVSTYNIRPRCEISLVARLDMILSKKQLTKTLISQPRCAVWSAPLLIANPEDMFSRVEAPILRR